eukprot:ctg_1066.g221
MLFVIGVAGPSASGKSSVVERIVSSLGSHSCAVLCLDCFYRGLPSDVDAVEYNFDSPNAFDFDACADVLERVGGGETARVPTYDYVAHQRCGPELVIPGTTEVLILEGILTFYHERVRGKLHLKVFVDEDADVRQAVSGQLYPPAKASRGHYRAARRGERHRHRPVGQAHWDEIESDRPAAGVPQLARDARHRAGARVAHLFPAGGCAARRIHLLRGPDDPPVGGGGTEHAAICAAGCTDADWRGVSRLCVCDAFGSGERQSGRRGDGARPARSGAQRARRQSGGGVPRRQRALHRVSAISAGPASTTRVGVAAGAGYGCHPEHRVGRLVAHWLSPEPPDRALAHCQPDAIASVCQAGWSRVRLVVSAIDRGVNRDGLVVPGIGWFAERYFGTGL